jgi:hypothetical protein
VLPLPLPRHKSMPVALALLVRLIFGEEGLQALFDGLEFAHDVSRGRHNSWLFFGQQRQVPGVLVP